MPENVLLRKIILYQRLMLPDEIAIRVQIWKGRDQKTVIYRVRHKNVDTFVQSKLLSDQNLSI